MNITRRETLRTLGLLGIGLIPTWGCRWDGHMKLLGYSTRPNYDESIKTVYVPIFKNRTFQAGPNREIEMELTRMVIREIEAKTPYKVLSDPDRADTELIGNVVGVRKLIPSRSPINQTRVEEVYLEVEIVWRDLRDGKILTNPAKGLGDPSSPPEQLPTFDPNNPPLPPGPETPRPVMITTRGRGVPELGESSTSGRKMAIDEMAVQIAMLMEKNWELPPSADGKPVQ
jgi:hypothetical protein